MLKCLDFAVFRRGFRVKKWSKKNRIFGAEIDSTGCKKTFNFAGQQPPQGAKLKINDTTVVTLHPALLAVLGQRAVA